MSLGAVILRMCHADLENADRQRTAAWASEKGALAAQAQTLMRETDSLRAEVQRLSVCPLHQSQSG